MAPTDGAIVTKMNMCTPQTTDVNISKGQSSRAIGLGGVQLQRSKSATILYKYRFRLSLMCPRNGTFGHNQYLGSYVD